MVLAVWPVTFPAPLSEVEEIAGYEAFLKARMAVSRDSETRNALAQELLAPREGLLRPSRMLGLRGSARGAWEVMGMEQRERWVASTARESPQRGYELLFVNGQRVGGGSRRGVVFDHSDAYKMLEEAEGGMGHLRGGREKRAEGMALGASLMGGVSTRTGKRGVGEGQRADYLNLLVVFRRMWTGEQQAIACNHAGIDACKRGSASVRLQAGLEREGRRGMGMCGSGCANVRLRECQRDRDGEGVRGRECHSR